MLTSYYGNLKKIVAPLIPVRISVGAPRWVRIEHKCPALYPTRAMLKMTREDYDAAYAAQLAKLDPKAIAEELGENAVLLCWEKPGEGCHRRIVAEWLEKALGIVVPELGIAREETLRYDETPWKDAKVKAQASADLFQ